MPRGDDGECDDDYMSDKFIPKSEDVRPGLVYQVTAKRRLEKEALQRQTDAASRTKKVRVIEAERRADGLATQLSTGNRGFDLLQKMGYKPGTSLGREGRTDGRIEPVPIELKSGRSGLGREELLRRKRIEVNEMKVAVHARRQKRLAELNRDFLRHQRTRIVDRQTKKDLYASQKSCQQLDQRMDLVEPAELWFWPPTRDKTEEDEEDKDSDEDEDDVNRLEPSEQLEILTEYLRNTHFFCVWCGTVYEDETDLTENCPGSTSDDH